MSTLDERAHGTAEQRAAELDAVLRRQRRAFMNEGPPSPDYVFVPDGRLDAFVDVARNTLHDMFGSIVSNKDYCSSVNQANFDRVVGLIEDARDKGAGVEIIAPVGESLPDRASRKIAPTIVRNVDERMKIASEEIFGPVLVVKAYSGLTEAIDYINDRPAPLVAYWYGPDDADFRTFVRSTRSGGVTRNDFAAQRFRLRRRSGAWAAAVWALTTARPVSTPSAITAPWWATICRSASPETRRRHSAGRCGWAPT